MAKEEKYTPEEFREKVAGYFKSCFREAKDGTGKTLVQFQPFDIVSLAEHLGENVKALKGYLERRDEIGECTREAFRTVEAYLNKKLITSGRTAGIQFYLKEHFGYDKRTLDINVMHHWSDKELEAQLRLALETLAASGEIDRDIINLIHTGGEIPTYSLPAREGQETKQEAVDNPVSGDRPA